MARSRRGGKGKCNPINLGKAGRVVIPRELVPVGAKKGIGRCDAPRNLWAVGTGCIARQFNRNTPTFVFENMPDSTTTEGQIDATAQNAVNAMRKMLEKDFKGSLENRSPQEKVVEKAHLPHDTGAKTERSVQIEMVARIFDIPENDVHTWFQYVSSEINRPPPMSTKGRCTVFREDGSYCSTPTFELISLDKNCDAWAGVFRVRMQPLIRVIYFTCDSHIVSPFLRIMKKLHRDLKTLKITWQNFNVRDNALYMYAWFKLIDVTLTCINKNRIHEFLRGSRNHTITRKLSNASVAAINSFLVDVPLSKSSGAPVGASADAGCTRSNADADRNNNTRRCGRDHDSLDQAQVALLWKFRMQEQFPKSRDVFNEMAMEIGDETMLIHRLSMMLLTPGNTQTQNLILNTHRGVAPAARTTDEHIGDTSLAVNHWVYVKIAPVEDAHWSLMRGDPDDLVIDRNLARSWESLGILTASCRPEVLRYHIHIVDSMRTGDAIMNIRRRLFECQFRTTVHTQTQSRQKGCECGYIAVEQSIFERVNNRPEETPVRLNTGHRFALSDETMTVLRAVVVSEMRKQREIFAMPS